MVQNFKFTISEKKIINENYEKLNSYEKWLLRNKSTSISFILINFFLSIVSLFIWLSFYPAWLSKKFQKINRKLLNGIQYSNVYKRVIDPHEQWNFISYSPSNPRVLMENKPRQIPGDAKIIYSSNLLTLTYLNKYIVNSQYGLATWTRSSGKSSKTYYRPIAYIKMFIPKNNELSKIYFNLRPGKGRNSTKYINLESIIFNSTFKLTSNDPLGVIKWFDFTTIGQYIDFQNEHKSKKWEVHKRGPEVLLSFVPKSQFGLEPTLNLFKNKLKSFEEVITLFEESITDDINKILNKMLLITFSRALEK